jgi:PIN domain nuclease of toxin-antitoxin system
VLVSIVSLLEITVRVRIGKLRGDVTEVTDAIGPSGFRLLALLPAHVIGMERLSRFPDEVAPLNGEPYAHHWFEKSLL